MATPYSLYVFDEVTSTQDVAASLFQGAPVLVVANRQSEGRGRRGRGWLTAPRALAASLAVSSSWPPSKRSLIPLLAGMAAARAVGRGCRLKWPNDLLLKEAKIGGLLVEAVSDRIIIGWGLNLFWPEPPTGIGALCVEDPGPGVVTSLSQAWVDSLLGAMDEGPQAWDPEEYRRLSATIGRRISWEPDGTGTALSVDAEGALIVATPSGPVALTAGEVRHLRIS